MFASHLISAQSLHQCIINHKTECNIINWRDGIVPVHERKTNVGIPYTWDNLTQETSHLKE